MSEQTPSTRKELVEHINRITSSLDSPLVDEEEGPKNLTTQEAVIWGDVQAGHPAKCLEAQARVDGVQLRLKKIDERKMVATWRVVGWPGWPRGCEPWFTLYARWRGREGQARRIACDVSSGASFQEKVLSGWKHIVMPVRLGHDGPREVRGKENLVPVSYNILTLLDAADLGMLSPVEKLNLVERSVDLYKDVLPRQMMPWDGGSSLWGVKAIRALAWALSVAGDTHGRLRKDASGRAVDVFAEARRWSEGQVWGEERRRLWR